MVSPPGWPARGALLLCDLAELHTDFGSDSRMRELQSEQPTVPHHLAVHVWGRLEFGFDIEEFRRWVNKINNALLSWVPSVVSLRETAGTKAQ